MTDDYEILPHTELEKMRSDITQIKENPFGQTETGQTMLDAMNNLTGSINRLLNVLETANEEIVRDYEDNKTSSRMDMIIEQNSKIAEGMVKIAEMVQSSTGNTPEPEFNEPAPKQEQSRRENPFGERLEQNLPRQHFDDPDLPSVKDLPPPPKGMPPIDDTPKPR